MIIRYECLRCGHPTEFHDRAGCTWPDPGLGGGCTCNVTIRDLNDDFNEPELTSQGQEWT